MISPRTLRHLELPGTSGAVAVVVQDGHLAWIGPDAEAQDFPGQVDATGALLTPSFVDAHVHATATGLALTGLDLAGTQSRNEMLEAIAAAARPGEVLLGHGWDESRWPDPVLPTQVELGRALGPASAGYFSRADLHSALASGPVLDGVVHEAGWVRLAEHHVVRSRALEAITPAQTRTAQQATRAEAARLGIGCLHEMSGPEVASAADLRSLQDLTASEPGPELVSYWGALGELEQAVELHAEPGGDLFVDGSFGSHTAALSAPYSDDSGTSGSLRYDVADLAAHITAAAARGRQAGFHCIGDRAIAAVLTAFEQVAGAVGLPGVLEGRHRLEHLELLDDAAAARVARLGLIASVQPVFDARWAEGMYVERLGAERAAMTNPFARLHRAGVALALGSDAPVTPLDPWGAIRAAVDARHGLTPRQAFAAHTVGGAQAARDRRPGAGRLRVGAPANVALWETNGLTQRDWFESVLGGLDPRLRSLLVNGRQVGPEGAKL